MVKNDQCCEKLFVIASGLLLMSGAVQTLIPVGLLFHTHLLYLVIQMLAGVWAVFTGTLCLTSLCKWKSSSHDSAHLLQIRMSLILNFLLETSSVILLILDALGFHLDHKPNDTLQYPPDSWLLSKRFILKEGSTILACAASVAWFTGLASIFSTLDSLQTKQYKIGNEVTVISAGWPYKSARISFYHHDKPFLRMSNDKITNDMPSCEPTKIAKIKKNGIFWKYSSKSEAKKSPMCRIASFKPMSTDDVGNRNSYVRFFEIDDIPLHRPVGFIERRSYLSEQPVFVSYPRTSIENAFDNPVCSHLDEQSINSPESKESERDTILAKLHGAGTNIREIYIDQETMKSPNPSYNSSESKESERDTIRPRPHGTGSNIREIYIDQETMKSSKSNKNPTFSLPYHNEARSEPDLSSTPSLKKTPKMNLDLSSPTQHFHYSEKRVSFSPVLEARYFSHSTDTSKSSSSYFSALSVLQSSIEAIEEQSFGTPSN